MRMTGSEGEFRDAGRHGARVEGGRQGVREG